MKRHYILSLALAAPLAVWASSPDTISTYAGGGPNNITATTANVAYPVATALDSACPESRFCRTNPAFRAKRQRILTNKLAGQVADLKERSQSIRSAFCETKPIWDARGSAGTAIRTGAPQ